MAADNCCHRRRCGLVRAKNKTKHVWWVWSLLAQPHPVQQNIQQRGLWPCFNIPQSPCIPELGSEQKVLTSVCTFCLINNHHKVSVIKSYIWEKVISWTVPLCCLKIQRIWESSLSFKWLNFQKVWFPRDLQSCLVQMPAFACVWWKTLYSVIIISLCFVSHQVFHFSIQDETWKGQPWHRDDE